MFFPVYHCASTLSHVCLWEYKRSLDMHQSDIFDSSLKQLSSLLELDIKLKVNIGDVQE
jgi:hypothetical protein